VHTKGDAVLPNGSLRNHFLGGLSAEDAASLQRHFRHIALPQGSIVNDAGQPIHRVIFPYSGAVSIVVRLSTGQCIDAGVIGRNGLIGGSAAFGAFSALNHAVVQIDLTGVAIDPVVLGNVAEDSPTLRSALVRSEQMLLAQAQQIAACNAAHNLEQRFCRWLANVHDLIGSDNLFETQELLSLLLGVRRSSMTLVAQHLQEIGLIDYKRGVIHIRDLERLRRAACECYAAMNAHFDRLVGWHPPPRRRRRWSRGVDCTVSHVASTLKHHNILHAAD
jgi:CRP-like cAMP-binding protein